MRLQLVLTLVISSVLAGCISFARSDRKPASEQTSSNFEIRITQPISHFKNDTGVFSQRVFINSKFVPGAWTDAPVFLVFCGEAACDKDTAESLALTETARKIGALFVTLEHRYYGESKVFDQLTAENLGYLSVREALADAAKAQTDLQKMFGLKGKWLATGCSYPGTLAALYRNANPHTVSGALSYSAGVMSNKPYRPDGRIEEALGKACYSDARKFLKRVENDIKDSPKAARLREELGMPAEIDARAILDAYYTAFTMAAQYGLSDVMCEKIKQREPTKALAQQLQLISDADASQLTLEGARFVDANHPWNKESGAGYRQFIYQACTEINIFPADGAGPNSLRPKSLNQNYFDEVCRKQFGITKFQNKFRTEFRAEYLESLASQRIGHFMFIDGQLDPFADLAPPARMADKSSNVEVIELTQGGHCAGSTSQDPLAAQVQPKVDAWVQDVLSQKTR